MRTRPFHRTGAMAALALALTLSVPGVALADPLAYPDSLAFGSVSVGSQGTLMTTIFNAAGGPPFSVLSMDITGSAAFTLDSPPVTPFLLGTDTYQDITVKYSPTAAGSDTGTLTFVTTDIYNVAVDLSGTGFLWDTSLSIKAPAKVAGGSKAKITGVLSSADAVCTASQEVFLKKGTATIGPKLTDGSGAYKFVTKITKKTVVKVTFAGTTWCDPSASEKKTIKVT